MRTPPLLTLLRLCLQQAGFLVDTASDGLEALDRLATQSYGAIVVDLQLSAMDGEMFWREAGARGHRVPTLLLSALPADHQTSAEPGMRTSLAKPFDVAQLCDVVRGLVASGDGSEPRLATQDNG